MSESTDPGSATPEAADWVTRVLAEQPDPALPAAVASRVEGALTAEVARRRAGIAADESEEALGEVRRRATLGSFGSNPPTHFDKPGLGIVDHGASTC